MTFGQWFQKKNCTNENCVASFNTVLQKLVRGLKVCINNFLKTLHNIWSRISEIILEYFFFITDDVEDVSDGNSNILVQKSSIENKNETDSSTSSLISATTSILKEKNLDITAEEEAEIQKKLSHAKAEIQNLITEGQRLRLANQKLQEDINLHANRYEFVV